MHFTEAGRYISDILPSGDLDSIYSIPTDLPPSYHDSIADLPPNYDLCEGLISVQLCSKDLSLPPHYSDEPQSSFLPLGSMTAPDIDLADTSNFRQAAGKKNKKQQAKAANQAKWADGGGEGSKDGGDGEENGEGGGGNNNGDGGAGDGGGGGDNWNNWDTGKKKKGKKAKEEDKKKQEEDEEEAKKEEEEAAKKDNPLSWADEANGDLGDDWGGFSTTKKDKKKKGKVR